MATTVVADIDRLLGHAKRATSRAVLEQLRELHRAPATTSAPAPPPPPPLLAREAAPPPSSVRFKSISKYMFDQSAKFAKVYVTVPGIEHVPDDAIRLDVHGGNSLTFEVGSLPAGSSLAPAAQLCVRTLHSTVEPSGCSWVRKADSMILLKLRKASDADEWGSLDDSAKARARAKEQELERNKGKSTQELLSKMYAEADEEGKASLAKAYETGRAKREGRA